MIAVCGQGSRVFVIEQFVICKLKYLTNRAQLAKG
jgi:hypothetical protein